MLEEIFKQFNASSSLILVVTILFYVVAWLYKEFKSMLEKDHQRKVAFVQRQLDLYSSTEASIAQVIHRPGDSNAIHNLYIKLGEASSYFSENLREVIRDFYKQGDHSILMILLSYLKAESAELYKKKVKWEEGDNSSNFMDKIIKLMYPIAPMLLALFLFFAALYVCSLAYLQVNLFNALSVYITFFTFVLSGSMIMMFFILIGRHQFNRMVKGTRKLMMIGAISAPLLILWDIRLSVITMVVQIVLSIMLYRTKSKTLIIF
ncbi:ABC-type multidrug transport system permease subunit [Paenibacillus turicensis]|uniref:ABC-type multidrug transport system permease subunit n=1 Tax=Paenibacillus turicensis TaxID=160487 RepID=A0ABS4FT85_9BACL|nr:hypothetical protein [Paenibacillus turicensis]MBP1905794.1 ABC-type multidrug transport system permease subunit [Paenibacillus turicensis]